MTKKPKTKFQKVMKWMGIAELVLLAAFLVWLLGFQFPLAFYKVEELNPGQYTMKFHRRMYYGSKEFTWRIGDGKRIGYADGLKNIVYKSTGTDNNKFIAVWNIWNVQLRGYGTFFREDIKVGPPSSQNIDKISFNQDEDVEAEIKGEILRAFDAYFNGKVKGVPVSDAHKNYKVQDIESFKCSHMDYNLFIYADIVCFNDTYYIHIRNSVNEYIPIANEIGEKIKEYY